MPEDTETPDDTQETEENTGSENASSIQPRNLDIKLDIVGDFSEGLAPVKENSKGNWGFIDTAGNVVLDFIYDMNWTPNEYRFVDGITPVILNGQGCYIDINGNIIIGKITEF